MLASSLTSESGRGSRSTIGAMPAVWENGTANRQSLDAS
jgi:hypothetical protein